MIHTYHARIFMNSLDIKLRFMGNDLERCLKLRVVQNCLYVIDYHFSKRNVTIVNILPKV